MSVDFNRALDNLFAPAGLDTGSEAPEEIALSIVAEVAAVLSGRVGGFLRERDANIHAETNDRRRRGRIVADECRRGRARRRWFESASDKPKQLRDFSRRTTR